MKNLLKNFLKYKILVLRLLYMYYEKNRNFFLIKKKSLAN